MTFCEGERFVEWDGCDVRTCRPCPGCAGLQLDWGVGFVTLLTGRLVKRKPYVMEWRCMSCNRVDAERMSTARLHMLRQAEPPPVLIAS